MTYISPQCRNNVCHWCPEQPPCGHDCHRGPEQESLFDMNGPDVRRGRHRRDDHATSVAGAASVSYRAGSQKARLLEVYRIVSPSGLSDEEAAIAAGLPLTSCYWKRCGELRQDGKIKDTGQTRVGQAGVPRIVSRYVG